ncbi:MAG TPA: glycosyl hydrolase, partial [Bacteroidia bacterium]|nr:glycosyl hydrolase [Bacteroidia bacterium]
SDKFHRAMNKGDDFKTLSTDLTKGGKKGNIPYGTITTINESPLKFGLLYMGTDDGLIYVSQDDGYNWKKISDNLPQNLKITRVFASNFDTAAVYASLSGYFNDDFTPYVYMSKNYGKTWEQIGTDLPMGEIVNVVKEDPKNKNLLYVGTDNGLYTSLDRGKSFMRFSGGMPAVSVHDLIVHPRDNDLVVGTHGRSIYIAHVAELQQLNDTTLAKELFAFKTQPVKYNAEWGKIPVSWSDTVEGKTTFAYYAKQKGITYLTIKTAGANGVELKTIKDTDKAGLNFVNYDLSIDSTYKAQYQTYLDADKSLNADDKKLSRADNKKYYLKPGKYEVVFSTQKDVSSKVNFTVKPAEKYHEQSDEPGE